MDSRDRIYVPPPRSESTRSRSSGSRSSGSRSSGSRSSGGQPDPGRPGPPSRQSDAAPEEIDVAVGSGAGARLPATIGLRAMINRVTLGLIMLGPGRRERAHRRYWAQVRREVEGCRQVTVLGAAAAAGEVNGHAAAPPLAMTFGRYRGGGVLAWDAGGGRVADPPAGRPTAPPSYAGTVLPEVRRGEELRPRVRAADEYDVLVTAGRTLTAAAFGEIRDAVRRSYRLIVVDAGDDVRAPGWQAAVDTTDQLVVVMPAGDNAARAAAGMLDHLESTGRQRLVRQAVSVISVPPGRRRDLPAIQRHFAARTRAVLLAPDARGVTPVGAGRYADMPPATRAAWLRIAAAVAEGL